MLAHCNLKQNMFLFSKYSSLFSFHTLPSADKLQDAVVHCDCFQRYMRINLIAKAVHMGTIVALGASNPYDL